MIKFKTFLTMSAVTLGLLAVASSSFARVCIGIGVGSGYYGPPQPVYYAPAPVYYAPPPPAAVVWMPGHWDRGYWIPGQYVSAGYPAPAPVAVPVPMATAPAPGLVWFAGNWGNGHHWHPGHWGHGCHHR